MVKIVLCSGVIVPCNDLAAHIENSKNFEPMIMFSMLFLFPVFHSTQLLPVLAIRVKKN